MQRPLRLVDRVRGRPDEQQPRFLLAVVQVQRDLDLNRLVAQRPEVLERALERRMEAAAGFARPAHQEHELLLVVAQAGLLGLEALDVGKPLGVEVVEQRRDGMLDLLFRHAFEHRDVGVQVHFHAHGGFSRGTGCAFYHAGIGQNRPSAAVN
jgi:hypothetical protein